MVSSLHVRRSIFNLGICKSFLKTHTKYVDKGLKLYRSVPTLDLDGDSVDLFVFLPIIKIPLSPKFSPYGEDKISKCEVFF